MSKSEQLNKLYNEYGNRFKGKEVVFGDGNIDSGLLLIGEAPGKDEVRLSKPFVGMAGKNLSEFLDVLGLDRSSLYITNAIKYRLSQVNPKTGRVVNKPASKDDIDSNRSFLVEEIQIIKPDYIVTLGNVPLKAVTGDYNASIGSVHGKLDTLFVNGSEYSVYPLYHPASIIYNRSLKDVYISDLKALKSIINRQ